MHEMVSLGNLGLNVRQFPIAFHNQEPESLSEYFHLALPRSNRL